MKKKTLKKEIKQLREEVKNQDLRMQLRFSSPTVSMPVRKNEDNEAVQEDQYRQEAYAKVEEWVSERFKAELEKIQEHYEQLLEAEKKVLKRYERKISGYSSESRFLKQEIKGINKKIILLEDKNKRTKAILKNIGFYAEVAAPGASLKEVSKGFKRKSRKKYEHSLPFKKRK